MPEYMYIYITYCIMQKIICLTFFKFRFGLLNCDSSSITQSRLLAAMACCHSLMVIDGQLTGDPLDLKMFQATDWVHVDTVFCCYFTNETNGKYTVCLYC